MQVAKQFKLDIMSNLDIVPTALYILSTPSVPEPARLEAISRAEQGEKITVKVAQSIVRAELVASGGIRQIEQREVVRNGTTYQQNTVTSRAG